MGKSRKRRSAKISDAVFRGKKGDHTFEVYPFGGEVPDEAAVFILSRRKLLRSGHVSHAVSCIGETLSVAAELKKHRRSKCVKTNESNVICVLREENEKNRNLKLIDLTSARMFGCVRGVFETTMLRKPDALHLAAARPPEPKLRRTPKIQKPETDETPIEQSQKRPTAAKPKSLRAGSKPKAKADGRSVKAKAASGQLTKPKKPFAAAARIKNANLKTVKTRSQKSEPTAKRNDKKAKDAKAARTSSANVGNARPKAFKFDSTTSVARSTGVKRSVSKSRSAASKKPISAIGPANAVSKRSKQKTEARPKSATAAASISKRTAAKARKGIQGGLDRDRGQHRLSKQKGAVRRKSKTGTDSGSGTRKKAAA